MTADPPRCDYFALPPRPQKMIMELLDFEEIYRLSVKSKKWQEKVKERNIKFDRYEIELGGESEWCKDDYFIRIIHHDEELLKILVSAEQQNGSYDDQINELIIAGDLLRHIFNFEKYGLTLSPSPSFQQMIRYQFFSTEVVCDRIIIRDDTPLLRDDLALLLEVFRGSELKTARISAGNAAHLPFHLEKVVIERTNWLTRYMAQNMNAKVVIIDQEQGCGVRVTKEYICSILDKWYDGGLSNLEYFRCNFFISGDDVRVMSAVLTSLRRTRRQWDHDGRLERADRHFEANTCRETDGKYAYILVKRRIGNDFFDFHFCTSTTRVINNRYEALNDRKPF